MFLHLSVSDSVRGWGGGVYPSMEWAGRWGYVSKHVMGQRGCVKQAERILLFYIIFNSVAIIISIVFNMKTFQ